MSFIPDSHVGLPVRSLPDQYQISGFGSGTVKTAVKGIPADRYSQGASVAEWLAYTGLRRRRARIEIAVATLSGNSIRQTVHKLPPVPLFTKQQNW